MPSKTRELKRRSHSAVVERACRRCGFVLGTNRGRCPMCFDAWADDRLAQYFDWLLAAIPGPGSPWHDGELKKVQALAAQTLAMHGPLLIPR